MVSTIIFFHKEINLMGSTDNLILFIQKSIQLSATSQQSDIPQKELADMILKAYEPATLFTAVFLSAWGVIRIVRSTQEALLGMALVMAGSLIAYQFMMLGLRAYTALFVLGIVTICFSQIKSPGFYTRLTPFILAGLALLWMQIDIVLNLLWLKQQVTGTNGKAGEWLAVIGTIDASPQTMLFGIGWGGTVENPILGEATRFTHSILSYYLLKSGVTGLVMLLAVASMLFTFVRGCNVAPLSASRWILLVSCTPPLLIGVLFEPTYKTLSYGVILALLVLSNVSIAKEGGETNGGK
jgi:hypothetical protein